jgi:hypothetical protein
MLIATLLLILPVIAGEIKVLKKCCFRNGRHDWPSVALVFLHVLKTVKRIEKKRRIAIIGKVFMLRISAVIPR